MATQILRTIDRWRFEVPLALVLAAAAGFAVMAMPHAIFARAPVVGGYGRPAHAGLALLAALLLGGIGYLAMRQRAALVTAGDEEDVEDPHAVPVGSVDEAEGGPLRLRRADRHPDAPPRAPIRASRDLGEPFMDVGTPVSSEPPAYVAPAPVAEAPYSVHAIADGDYVEIEPVEEPAIATPVTQAAEPEAIDAAPEPIEPVVAAPIAAEPEAGTAAEPVHAEAPVAQPMVVEPSPVAPPPRDDASLAAMMERLSSGMARRAAAGSPVAPGASAREMRPALRDALDELNRLAARRG